jgi:hypothetical protein
MNIYPPLSKELPPERNVYSQRYFVGRDAEVKDFVQKMEEGQAGYSITRPVVHLWGAPGIGKSWLLHHVCQQPSGPCALVDFSTMLFSARQPASIFSLLEHLDRQLQDEDEAQLEPEVQAVKDFKDKLAAIQVAEGYDQVTELTGLFVQALEELSKRSVIMLLFDAVENLSAEDFFWLEHHLLGPLARTDRIVIVVSGRHEIPRWKEFSVRQRLERREIKSFNFEITKEQLQRLGVMREDPSEIYRNTLGHPYANQVWGTLKERQEQKLEKVESELLSDVKSEVDRDILRTLSTLRRFNVESARELLGGILGEDYESMSDGDYLRLFERLEKTNLVYWHPERRAYVMDPSIRRIIDLRIQMGAPHIFRKRHEIAGNLYKSWFEKNPRDRGALLIEVLYHASRKIAEEAAPEVKGQITSILDEYLTEDLGADDIDMLRRQLQRDQDFQEHGSVMPAEALQELQARVQQRVSDVITTSGEEK